MIFQGEYQIELTDLIFISYDPTAQAWCIVALHPGPIFYVVETNFTTEQAAKDRMEALVSQIPRGTP